MLYYRTKVMQALRSSAIGYLYQGQNAILLAAHEVRSSVCLFVCFFVCQQAKTEKVAYLRLFTTLGDHTWQVVSMDFGEGLPSSSG